MMAAARDHASDQSSKGITGHTGTDGSSPKDRIKRYVSFEGGGENIQYGFRTAVEVIL
jgi:uncharacterized protein YkwD